MVKVTNPLLSDSASGSVGNVLTYRGLNGQMVLSSKVQRTERGFGSHNSIDENERKAATALFMRVRGMTNPEKISTVRRGFEPGRLSTVDGFMRTLFGDTWWLSWQEHQNQFRIKPLIYTVIRTASLQNPAPVCVAPMFNAFRRNDIDLKPLQIYNAVEERYYNLPWYQVISAFELLVLLARLAETGFDSCAREGYGLQATWAVRDPE